MNDFNLQYDSETLITTKHELAKIIMHDLEKGKKLLFKGILEESTISASLRIDIIDLKKAPPSLQNTQLIKLLHLLDDSIAYDSPYHIQTLDDFINIVRNTPEIIQELYYKDSFLRAYLNIFLELNIDSEIKILKNFFSTHDNNFLAAAFLILLGEHRVLFNEQEINCISDIYNIKKTDRADFIEQAFDIYSLINFALKYSFDWSSIECENDDLENSTLNWYSFLLQINSEEEIPLILKSFIDEDEKIIPEYTELQNDFELEEYFDLLVKSNIALEDFTVSNYQYYEELKAWFEVAYYSDYCQFLKGYFDSRDLSFFKDSQAINDYIYYLDQNNKNQALEILIDSIELTDYTSIFDNYSNKVIDRIIDEREERKKQELIAEEKKKKKNLTLQYEKKIRQSSTPSELESVNTSYHHKYKKSFKEKAPDLRAYISYKDQLDSSDFKIRMAHLTPSEVILICVLNLISILLFIIPDHFLGETIALQFFIPANTILDFLSTFELDWIISLIAGLIVGIIIHYVSEKKFNLFLCIISAILIVKFSNYIVYILCKGIYYALIFTFMHILYAIYYFFHVVLIKSVLGNSLILITAIAYSLPKVLNHFKYENFENTEDIAFKAWQEKE